MFNHVRINQIPVLTKKSLKKILLKKLTAYPVSITIALISLYFPNNDKIQSIYNDMYQ